MEEDLKSWMSIIRSCVITSQRPLTVQEINWDTKALEGANIPFRKFNFCSLEDMLRKTPGLKVFQQSGQTYVQVIPSKETEHILQMVRRQKSKTKKNRKFKSNLNQRVKTYNQNSYYKTNKNGKNKTLDKSFKTPNKYGVTNDRILAPSTRTPQVTSAPPQAKLKQAFLPPCPHKQENFPPMATSTAAPPRQHPYKSRNNFAPYPQRSNFVPYPPGNNYNPSWSNNFEPYCQQPIWWQDSLEFNIDVPAPPTFETNNYNSNVNVLQQKLSNLLWSMDDPCLRLIGYTMLKKYPEPEYKIYKMNNSFFSVLKVNWKTYKSFPHHSFTEEGAKQIVASVALQNIAEGLLKEKIWGYDHNRKPSTYTAQSSSYYTVKPPVQYYSRPPFYYY